MNVSLRSRCTKLAALALRSCVAGVSLMHRKVLVVFMCVLAVIGALIWATPMAAKKPSKSDPIHATFRDNFTDKITSDCSTGNCMYPDGMMDGVKAVLNGRGNFVIDPEPGGKKNPDPRFFRLIVENGSPTADPELFDGTLVSESNPYRSFFMSINATGLPCNGSSGALTARDMGPNDCLRYRVALNLPDGLLLRCGFNANNVGGELDPTGTDEIKVACALHDGTRCSEWDIKPFTPGGTERLICRLFEHRSGKGKNATHETVFLADFDMPFGLTVGLDLQ